MTRSAPVSTLTVVYLLCLPYLLTYLLTYILVASQLQRSTRQNLNWRSYSTTLLNSNFGLVILTFDLLDLLSGLLWHIGIYRHTWQPGFVKIRRTVLEICRKKRFRDLFWPHMTLTFELLALKVERVMPLPREPLVPTGIKIGSFVFKISHSQVW